MINMIRAILLQYSSHFSLFNAISLFYFEIIKCKKCIRIDNDLIKTLNFAYIAIIDFTINLLIL